MRTAEDVRNRVVALLESELDRRVHAASERLPHRCAHNHRQPLDSRRRVGGEANGEFNRISRGTEGGRGLPVIQSIGLCMLGSDNPEEWSGTICEDPVDAKRCPYFTPTTSKEELFAAFTSDLQDPVWIETNLPEVSTLLWVLEAMQVPRISWWKKLWFQLARIKIEPVNPAFDPARLLLPHADGSMKKPQC